MDVLDRMRLLVLRCGCPAHSNKRLAGGIRYQVEMEIAVGCQCSRILWSKSGGAVAAEAPAQDIPVRQIPSTRIPAVEHEKTAAGKRKISIPSTTEMPDGDLCRSAKSL
jgi:hypothetical protein